MVAHGSTAKGNDQVRIEVSVKALDPSIEVIAPARLWRLSRSEEIENAKQRNGIPVSARPREPVFHRRKPLGPLPSECGLVGDCWREPPEEVYWLTKSPGEAPERAAPNACVEIVVQPGRSGPDQRRQRWVWLGRSRVCRPLPAHMASGALTWSRTGWWASSPRDVYEAPAARHAAHAAHAGTAEDGPSRRLRATYLRAGCETTPDLVYNGLWFTPMREAIDALVMQVAERVTGVIRLKLFKGSCRVVGRQSARMYEPRPGDLRGRRQLRSLRRRRFVKI